jgi:hypothetical protein
MRKLVFVAFCFISCQKETIEPFKKKIACKCNDGSTFIWNENILKQTGWTTGNPCWDKGGIKEYIYGN